MKGNFMKYLMVLLLFTSGVSWGAWEGCLPKIKSLHVKDLYSSDGKYFCKIEVEECKRNFNLEREWLFLVEKDVECNPMKLYKHKNKLYFNATVEYFCMISRNGEFDKCVAVVKTP